MQMSDKRFIIGIDLGTTNSAVSYVDLAAPGSRDGGDRNIQDPTAERPRRNFKVAGAAFVSVVYSGTL